MAETTDVDDAKRALREHDEAQRWDPPPRLMTDPSLVPVEAPQGPASLEDIYVRYPNIGAGDWKVRIERVAPQHFAGMTVAGFLGDFKERISTDELKRRYGGGKYNLYVMCPQQEGGFRRVGHPLRLTFPGAPTMEGIDDMMQQRGIPLMTGEPPEVARERMRIDHEREKAGRERLDRLQAELRDRGVPTEIIDQMRATAQQSLDTVRESMSSSMALWQRQVEKLEVEKRELDAMVAALRKELLETKQSAYTLASERESRAVQDLRATQAGELQRQAESHQRRLDEIKGDYDRRLEDARKSATERVQQLTDVWTKERRDYESQQTLERERLREDAKTRIDALQDAQRREVESLKTTYEARIADIKQSTERELTAARNHFDAELRAIQTGERATATFSEKAADMKASVWQAELAQKRAECEDLRRRAAELERELHKPLLQQLGDLRKNAELVGMVDASEMREAEPAAPSTAQQVIGVVGKFVENAPKIIETLKGPQPQQPQPQYVGRGQPQPQMQRVGGGMLPPGLAPQRMPGPAVQPVATVQGRVMPSPPPRVTVPMGSHAAPGPRTATPLGSAAPPSPPAPPPVAPTDQMAAESAASPPQQPSAAPAGPPGPAQPPAGGASPGAESLVPLLEQIEAALHMGTVSPEQFARGLVDSVGPDMVRIAIDGREPGQLVEVARQMSGGSSLIGTRDGERYVHSAWVHARHLVGAAT